MSFLRFIMKKDKAKVRFFCKVAPLVLEVVMSEKQILINCAKTNACVWSEAEAEASKNGEPFL